MDHWNRTINKEEEEGYRPSNATNEYHDECSYSGFRCPMYLLSLHQGSILDQLGLIHRRWLTTRLKIDQVLSILVVTAVFCDLWCIITATDNTIGRVINDGVGLNRRCHINLID